MPGQIDEIKARVDIVELVGEYVRLKQAGTNWRALCPFHNEKTPSFMVSRDKQIWHCFGCSEGGDIFTFVQKMEGLEFPEALRLLAQRAGVKLEAQDPQISSQRNRLMDLSKLAARFWHQVLLDSKLAEEARVYLKQRGLSENTIQQFHNCDAPDSWDASLQFFKKKGFNDQEIFLAGLTVKKDRGEGFYDRFRDRIIFPINDLHGTTVGFSARTLKKDESAKYINTPQTMVYNKSLVLFNLDKAKAAIKKENAAVLVEGQMDVIAAWQAGTENVIAVSGTALTLDQVKILKRYTNTITLSFDTDAAGESAARRGVDVALGQEMELKVIVLPHGKDPDECIKKNPADWQQAVKEAKPLLAYYFDRAIEQYGTDRVEGKKQIAQALLPLLAKVTNRIEQTHWLQKVAQALNVTEQVLRERLPVSRVSVAAAPVLPTAKPSVDRGKILSERLLALALKYPHHLKHIIDSVGAEFVTDQALGPLYSQLIVYYTKKSQTTSPSFEREAFQRQLPSPELVRAVDTLLLLADKDFGDLDDEQVRQEITTVVHLLKKRFYQERLQLLEGKIRQAETTGRRDELNTLAQEFNALVEQFKLLQT